ncbi:lipoprotein [Spirochaetia bacterium]|nr:lipoprotein [Spirochaetia bacterium]
MKKAFLLVLALIMTVGMVFAGGSKESKPVTLRFSWWGTDARHAATLAVIDAFEKANPNIKIEPEYGAQTGYNDKKTTEFASGTAPDIFQIETGAGPEYYSLGVLYNLSRLSSIKFDNFERAFLVENGQFDSGSQYAIPTGVAGTALVVNKTLADKIGIDLTKQFDWEQLIVWGQQVRASDPTVYLLSANAEHAMPFFVRGYARQLNGAPIINDEKKTLNMTEAQFTEVFELVDRIYKSGTAAPAAYKAPFGNQDQNDPNWIAGKYVAHVGYTSSAEVVQAANPSVEYYGGALPLLANRKSDGWSNNCPQYMGIYAKTKYPEESAKFLDFFFNSEEAARLLGTVRSIPPTAMAQKIVADAGVLNQLTANTVAKSLTYKGMSDGSLTTAAEATKILLDAYEAVSYGSKTPAAAAKEVVEQLNAFLARL